MFFGRLLGWAFLLLAALTASAESVAALNTGEYIGLATSDVLTIITGISPQTADTFAGRLLLWPAWVVVAVIGLTLIIACRPKKTRKNFS